MPGSLDLPVVTVTIHNEFVGPNFVNGLAKQSSEYTIVSDTLAVLTFKGGFDDSITYVQNLNGTGFGYDSNGRMTGYVDSWTAYEQDNPLNGWSFTNFGSSLDRLNSLASDPNVTFADLLVIPLVYNFVGAQYDDIYIYGSFNDEGHGYGGNDNFNGLAGDDTLYGDGGKDSLFGERGDDDLYGGSGNDVIFGGRGFDFIDAGTGDDTVYGDADDDLILGGDGNDILNGDDGEDAIEGGSGNDTIKGGDGGDLLIGEQGNDMIIGGEGSDRMIGGGGADTLKGDDGDNFLNGGGGNDILIGGADDDTLSGNAGDDVLKGMEGTNFMSGGTGNDTIRGGGDSDELFGDEDDDRLYSGAGADFLEGGTGNDVIFGNNSDGSGDFAVDTFIFVADFGNDVIKDFEIGFDGIEFAGGITSDQVSTATSGNNVIISVDQGELGIHTVQVSGVAALFNPEIDILIA